MRAVRVHGQKWSRIRDLGLIPGRSDAQLRERLDDVLRGMCSFTKSVWQVHERLGRHSSSQQLDEGGGPPIDRAGRRDRGGKLDCDRRSHERSCRLSVPASMERLKAVSSRRFFHLNTLIDPSSSPGT